MAFASTTEWDVRTTGADDNGGGWNTAASGTDYSQQNSPQVTYTDLVIDGADNTKITSAATPFAAAHVGNIINITSGTGFTVQRVQINSVASNIATCDKAVGTVGSTGGNGKLGGALLTIQTAVTSAASLNTVHIKSGTYTLTTQVTVDTSARAKLKLWGYNAAHGDNGTKPLITTATDSTFLFRATSATAGYVQWENLSFSTTATTKAAGIYCSASQTALLAYACKFDTFPGAMISDGDGPVSFIACELTACTTQSYTGNAALIVHGCYIHDGGASATQFRIFKAAVFTNTIFDTITGGTCVLINGDNVQAVFVNNTFYNNSGGKCIDAGDGPYLLVFANNIFYSNSGGAFNLADPAIDTNHFRGLYNAFGSNGSSTNYTADPTDITLTADPFTNGGSGNFGLNSTAGGGAVVKAAGFPGAFLGATTTGYGDVGASQTQASTTITRVLANPGMGGGIQG